PRALSEESESAHARDAFAGAFALRACRTPATRAHDHSGSSASPPTHPWPAQLLRDARRVRQLEIDLALVDDHIDQTHPQVTAQAENATAARSDQPIARVVARKIIRTQRAHVHQAVDLQPPSLDEQPEIDHARHDRIELLADLVAHVFAFEPR